MVFYFYLLSFAFGTIIGSFLNVVIYRLNSGFGIGGRSQCFSCGKTLHWYELVPLVSFLMLRGRCSICKAKISWQYFLIELITGFTFVLLLQKGVMLFGQSLSILNFSWFLLSAIIFSTLVVVAVYDLRHMIIPDSLSILFAVTSFMYLIVFRSSWFFSYSHGGPLFSWITISPLLIDISAGLAFSLFFFVFWFFSKGTWMGLGDAKLAVGIGFFLGWGAGTASLMISFWIGAVVGILLLGAGKLLMRFKHKNSLLSKMTIKSEVPFAPFLVFSVFLVFFFGITFDSLQSFVRIIFRI